MKAIAVRPPTPNSVHLVDVPAPTLEGAMAERGVLVRTLQVGVDATDSEINQGEYGQPPEGDEHLVIGHEVFGQVEAIGSKVADLSDVRPGDFVTCTVRRPGTSLYDLIGRNDITGDETYYERGINLRHGFLTERFVDDVEYMVRVPPELAHLGVLSEPLSVCYKAIEQAYEAQRRLHFWRPRVAFVTGAGQIGLLTAMMCRLRGLKTFVFARTIDPGLKEEIAAGYGAEYVSTKQRSMAEVAAEHGKPDLIVEATGAAQVAFEAMEVLNINGALVWTSVTGKKKSIEVPAATINLEWVLGNKLLVGSVNGNRDHFRGGLKEAALAEAMSPGVTQRILTHPVEGLEDPEKIMTLLESDALKVYVDIAKPA